MKRKKEQRTELNRREFIKISGTLYLVATIGSCSPQPEQKALSPVPPRTEKVDLATLEHPPSKGYLLVDTQKCQGCCTCMLMCSLVNEGRENLSLARLQVLQTPFERFPDDVTLEQCRQCLDPACVAACPTGAVHVALEAGNVRTINPEKCEACFSCVQACPFQPSRAMWNFEQGRPFKCDLCLTAPHWPERGGYAGKQACVEVCPVGALTLSESIPLQKGESGYKVNLRGEAWARLGYPVD